MSISLDATTADVIDYRAAASRGLSPVGFFDSDGLIQELTGAQLLEQAHAVAAGLAHHGVRFQDRVIILAPTGPDYLTVLLGCLLSGVAPCTVAPPTKPGDPDSAGVRHLHAAINAVRPSAVIISDVRLRAAVPNGTPLIEVPDLRGHGSVDTNSFRQPEPEQIHHIQLTSGSTSAPKATVLTHANVAANLTALRAATSLVPDRDRFFSWLPLYHDMGLVLVLLGLSSGAPLDLMSPVGFVRDPLSWLRHISSRQATITAAPPFAYRAAADRHARKGRSPLDLSSLRQAYVGAEPISVGVLQQFQDTFAEYGLAEDTLVPCYGMAETVLATTLSLTSRPVTGTSFGRVHWHDLDRTALDEHRIARPALPRQPAHRIVSCGSPIDGLSLRLTHHEGNEVAEGEIGAISVRGQSVMAGYLTADGVNAPPDGWHDTGDLGLLLDGELYVVGRTKEMLIVRGRNLPPYDVERVIEEHPAVDAGASAVFSHQEETAATEQVTAVVETRAKHDQWSLIRTEITTSVRQAFGLSLADVVIVGRGGIPRTSSGKRQRDALRTAYLAGQLT